MSFKHEALSLNHQNPHKIAGCVWVPVSPVLLWEDGSSHRRISRSWGPATLAHAVVVGPCFKTRWRWEQTLKVVLWPPHLHHGTVMHPLSMSAHMHIHKKMLIKLGLLLIICISFYYRRKYSGNTTNEEKFEWKGFSLQRWHHIARGGCNSQCGWVVHFSVFTLLCLYDFKTFSILYGYRNALNLFLRA